MMIVLSTIEASSEGDTGRVGRDTVIGIEVVDVELTWKYYNGDHDDELTGMHTVIEIGDVDFDVCSGC